jgi:peptidoglycan/xylan/chitin deacetylase (PgdA/CDA1 family)
MESKHLPKDVSGISARDTESATRATLCLRLPVLMYHRIAPDSGSRLREFTVSPEKFRLHLEVLKQQGFRTVRPGEFEALQRGSVPIPAKAVLLTFDDAHAALAEHAFPLLRQYGFTAVVFVPTAYVGKDNGWGAAAGWGPFPLLGANDIRAWASEGIEFGAHSRTHPDLTRLTGAELEREIAGSREDLESLLGAPVAAFAYPYGKCDPAVRDFVRQHYRWAFTGRPGVNHKKTDAWTLRRAMVLPDDDERELKWRLFAGWTPREAFAWFCWRTKRAVGGRRS